MIKLNDGLYADMQTQFKFTLEHNYVDHQLNIEVVDLRAACDRYYGHDAEVLLFQMKIY